MYGQEKRNVLTDLTVCSHPTRSTGTGIECATIYTGSTVQTWGRSARIRLDYNESSEVILLLLTMTLMMIMTIMMVVVGGGSGDDDDDFNDDDDGDLNDDDNDGDFNDDHDDHLNNDHDNSGMIMMTRMLIVTISITVRFFVLTEFASPASKSKSADAGVTSWAVRANAAVETRCADTFIDLCRQHTTTEAQQSHAQCSQQWDSYNAESSSER